MLPVSQVTRMGRVVNIKHAGVGDGCKIVALAPLARCLPEPVAGKAPAGEDQVLLVLIYADHSNPRIAFYAFLFCHNDPVLHPRGEKKPVICR